MVYRFVYPRRAVEKGIVQVVAAVGDVRQVIRIEAQAALRQIIDPLGAIDAGDFPGVGRLRARGWTVGVRCCHSQQRDSCNHKHRERFHDDSLRVRVMQVDSHRRFRMWTATSVPTILALDLRVMDHPLIRSGCAASGISKRASRPTPGTSYRHFQYNTQESGQD